MKTLIVEDDFASRLVLEALLKKWGTSHTAVNGIEAVNAFRLAMEADQPYDLICLDIMMPQMDGQEALRQIRAIEEQHGILSSDGVKVIMTTALRDITNIKNAFHGLCDAYLVKPIDREKLSEHLKAFALVT